MIDQERLKGYIDMGFDKDEAYKMCQEEEAAEKKEAAKAAKIEAAKEEAKTEETEKNENSFNDEVKAEIEKIADNVIKEKLKNEAIENIINNGGGEVKEVTVQERLRGAVKDYYTK